MKYTEKDTERYYDKEDAVYRSFWDPEGSLHWGIFTKKTKDFLAASNYLTKKMSDLGKINSSSNVLDLGCGDGKAAIDLVQMCKCTVVGVDLSGVRIKNAKRKLLKQPKEIQERVKFIKETATSLPFAEGTFSHVWSQSTIYHVHDKKTALKEIYRVLKNGGIFVFDDLFKPKPKISADAKKYLYDRLLFTTDFNFISYQTYLEKVGFKLIKAIDISEHLKKSYRVLSIILQNKLQATKNKKMLRHYRWLIRAYQGSVAAVDAHEVGWALYVCKKSAK